MKNIVYLLLFLQFCASAQTLRGVVTKENIRGYGDKTELSAEAKKLSYYQYQYSNGASLLELISEQGTKIDTSWVKDDRVKEGKLETTTATIKSHSSYHYKNFKTNVYRLEFSTKDRNLINVDTSIKDTIPIYTWALENTNQTIAGFNCKKATTINNVGARAINVTAWYCEDLPISDGPMAYSGLPGMILQLEIEKNTIIKFEKLKYFKNENIDIKAPENKTDMITLQEYIKKQNYAKRY